MNLFESGDSDPKNHTIGGILGLSFYWRDMIRDILPPGENGLVVVFENECNPTCTYQINGPTVEFLGVKVAHNPKYNDMEMKSWLNYLRKFALKDRGFTGIPVASDICPFHISVFPSDTMLSSFQTSNPVILSVSAGIIFLLFAVVFIWYDKFVERRQNLVMHNAAQSAAIVSSLFPESVRRCLMDGEGANDDSSFTSRKYRLKSFLSDEKGDKKAKKKVDQKGSAPISDLFPFATVLFMDIAGFTAWSSTRDPSQVFLLLETIYAAFGTVFVPIVLSV
jgi:hypothetical protein